MPARIQRGQAIVLIAVMLAILIGMVALAIDGSRGYAVRRDLQAAVDSAALAAGDRLQATGSYTSAEQAATGVFAANMKEYPAPSCSPYGAPGATPLTVTCTYSDGTVLTLRVSALGPQGTSFVVGARRTLQLDFARILWTAANPVLGASASGSTNNLLYAPAVGALGSDGCGGSSGSVLTVSGTGNLTVFGDVVSNGAITVAAGGAKVAGDVYARCQSSVAGASTVCYPGGAATPCVYPELGGATRSGFRLGDPDYPAPSQFGGAQSAPSGDVVLPSGIYASPLTLTGAHCWFMSGGVYGLPSGFSNQGDLVSNELKPPDEPLATDNTQRAASQFWNTGGVNCSGSYQLQRGTGGDGDIATGNWSFEVTSMRSDNYNGVSYVRESAPSMCDVINVNPHFNDVQISISNVPGATSYNVYAAPPGNGCGGKFGLAANIPVTSSVLNTNTNPCPAFTGNGCSLGHESADLGSALEPPFAPNRNAGPGTPGAYPPDPEQPPLAAGLPNLNAARGSGVSGDRANEDHCATPGGATVACPAAVTPGAVELYAPVGGCITTSNSANTYLFSGYQYDWIAAYEPASNTCSPSLGGSANSAYIGLFYAPGATIAVPSPYSFEAAGTAGILGSKVTFTGTLPTIRYGSDYSPVPPASRLVG